MIPSPRTVARGGSGARLLLPPALELRAGRHERGQPLRLRAGCHRRGRAARGVNGLIVEREEI